MIKYENECCGCAVPGYPCLGSECHNRHVPHYYCDKCEEECESEELYDDDGEMLCQTCLLENYKTVAQRLEEGHIYD